MDSEDDAPEHEEVHQQAEQPEQQIEEQGQCANDLLMSKIMA